MVTIKIAGPGLVVNRPVAVVYKALVDAGYKVELGTFEGQHQYTAPEEWPEKELASTHQSGMEIDVSVDPQPWGG